MTDERDYDPIYDGPRDASNPPPPPIPDDDREARLWAMTAHLSGPVGGLVTAGILPFVAPLVIWMASRAGFDDRKRETVPG